MKKILIVFIVGVLLLSACDAVKVQEESVVEPPNAQSEARDPVIESLATQQAELAQAVSGLATQMANLVQSDKASEAQPVSGSGSVVTSAAKPSISNDWEINELDLKDDPIVAAWLPKVQKPAPELWPTFPNVANPKVADFNIADGVEYGQDDSPFCEQDQRCDWVIPAWHYRLISGDYKFTSPEFSYSCQNIEGQPRKGCLIVLFNVMNESFTWRDQSVDNGFTVMGRYWNGDALQWAVWGLTSHATANMLNYPTIRNSVTGDVLNAGSAINAGANCGVQPDACGVVDVMVVIHAGDRILATMHTTVSR